MDMYRFAQGQLVRWKSARRRKPLIVRGARQVGKTWLIERFAAVEFDELVKVDLEKRRDLHDCFGDDLDARTVLRRLELDSGRRIVAGRTLLFLDEVQACPRAIMALRYLYEQTPELHVIAAGSLLEFAMGEIPVPVGRLQELHLYPHDLSRVPVGDRQPRRGRQRHRAPVGDGRSRATPAVARAEDLLLRRRDAGKRTRILSHRIDRGLLHRTDGDHRYLSRGLREVRTPRGSDLPGHGAPLRGAHHRRTDQVHAPGPGPLGTHQPPRVRSAAQGSGDPQDPFVRPVRPAARRKRQRPSLQGGAARHRAAADPVSGSRRAGTSRARSARHVPGRAGGAVRSAGADRHRRIGAVLLGAGRTRIERRGRLPCGPRRPDRARRGEVRLSRQPAQPAPDAGCVSRAID